MDQLNVVQEHVAIPCEMGELKGVLSTLKKHNDRVVIFAHGSGSGRLSPRNMFVSERLQQAGFCTLLFDLLTEEEEEIDLRTRHLRFDIPLLAKRLERITHWLLSKEGDCKSVGYFGASTGAAAALMAATSLETIIKAVVSRGGRPDLAGGSLSHVIAPTLLVVGELDEYVIELNRKAMIKMRGSTVQLEIVPHATHLFEENGALTKVADLATKWFKHYMGTVVP